MGISEYDGSPFCGLSGTLESIKTRNGISPVGTCLNRFGIQITNVAFEMCFGRNRADVVHCSRALPTLRFHTDFLPVTLWVAINSGCLRDAFLSSIHSISKPARAKMAAIKTS